ncbi:MAG: cyclic nucleotide-binding domain-containing protein [Desulfobacterales bacterium]|jgi:CRP-like cAMP-binding protein
MEQADIRRALEECEFFSGLVSGDLAKVAELCQVQTYEVGETLFRQGDFGEHLWALVDGQVSLERTVELGKQKGSVVITTLGKGRILGCWSSLLGEPHILMCSAVCEKPAVALRLSGARLREIMHADTDLGYAIMEKLCFLLRDRVQSAYGALERI